MDAQPSHEEIASKLRLLRRPVKRGARPVTSTASVASVPTNFLISEGGYPSPAASHYDTVPATYCSPPSSFTSPGPDGFRPRSQPSPLSASPPPTRLAMAPPSTDGYGPFSSPTAPRLFSEPIERSRSQSSSIQSAGEPGRDVELSTPRTGGYPSSGVAAGIGRRVRGEVASTPVLRGHASGSLDPSDERFNDVPRSASSILPKRERPSGLRSSTPPPAASATSSRGPADPATSRFSSRAASGHSGAALARSAPSSPSGMQAPGSVASSQALRIAEGAQYLDYDDLPMFEPPANEATVSAVLRHLGSDDWNLQFQSIDDVRRLARFAPRLISGDRARFRKVIAAIVGLVDALRSALAKNALRCVAELFHAMGSRMDVDLDALISSLVRRSADTNAFISEEADISLREACRLAGSEARLLTAVQAALAHRRPEYRARAAWCLSMLAQRLGQSAAEGRLRSDELLRSVAEATAKTLGDANPDVRQAARLVAVVLSVAAGIDELPDAGKLHAAVAASGLSDPAGFDAFDLDSCRPSTAGGARPGLGVSPSASSGGRNRSSLQGRS